MTIDTRWSLVTVRRARLCQVQYSRGLRAYGRSVDKTPGSLDEPTNDTTQRTLLGRTKDIPTLEHVPSFVYLKSTSL